MESLSVESILLGIFTLLGTFIGALASFLSSYFLEKQKIKNSREIAKENRDRGRIEELIGAFFELEKQLADALFKIIERVHYEKDNDMNFYPDSKKNATILPPMKKIGVTISLYYPELEEEFKLLRKSSDTFYSSYFDIMKKNYFTENTKAKQKVVYNSVLEQKKYLEKIENLTGKLMKKAQP